MNIVIFNLPIHNTRVHHNIVEFFFQNWKKKRRLLTVGYCMSFPDNELPRHMIEYKLCNQTTRSNLH